MRRSKAGSRRTRVRRPDEQLPFFIDEQVGSPALLLDTCVYIDRLQGRAPKVLDDLIATRQTNHSTVAIQELMHTVGVLPDDRRTATAISAIGRLINAMRPHRVFSPDADVLGRAAFLSGVLCRVQGSSKDTRLRSLQDCTLYLQAQKLGLTILTANVGDFDALMQMTNTHGVLSIGLSDALAQTCSTATIPEIALIAPAICGVIL